MKRVCKRPIQLDAVTLCYEVVHPTTTNNLPPSTMASVLIWTSSDYIEQRADTLKTFMLFDWIMAHVILNGAT